jgi:hypothetical protein
MATHDIDDFEGVHTSAVVAAALAQFPTAFDVTPFTSPESEVPPQLTRSDSYGGSSLSSLL